MTIVTAASVSVAALGAGAASATGSTELVSRGSGVSGAPGNAASEQPSISANGNAVAFESTATNLVPEDTDSIRDVYVRNRLTGETVLVSRATSPTGAKGDGPSHHPEISADGRYVVFSSDAENLAPGGTDAEHVYVRDLVTNTTILVDRASGPAGATGNGISGAASISSDGRFVAFASVATNLDPTDANGFVDIYLRDLESDTTTLITRGADGSPSDERSSDPLISADATAIAFFSWARNLTPAPEPQIDPDNGGIFIFDLETGVITLASRASGANGAVARSDVYSRSISTDGSRVAFWTGSERLHAADRDKGFDDVFVRDLLTNRTLFASRGLGKWGKQKPLASTQATLSADGSQVAFETFYSGRRARMRASIRDLGRRKTTTVAGAQDSQRIVPMVPTLSGDASWLAFESVKAYDKAEPPGVRDVFVSTAP